MKDILNECSELPVRNFAPHKTVIEQGTHSGVLYILAEGSIEILKGDFQINTVDSAGSIFGEISVLLDLPHTATVKTLEASSFFIAEHPTDFLKAHPNVHVHMSRLLAKRLNRVTSYLVDLKKQFEDQEDHLGMVDEVLESLVHDQPENSGGAPNEPIRGM